MSISESQKKRIIPLLFLPILSLLFSPNSAGEQFYVGNTVVNACLTIPVFSAPSVESQIIGQASFGDSFRVTSLEGIYELPASDPNSEAAQRERLGESGEDFLDPNLYRQASWAGVEGRGFVSAACLVKQDLFAKQNPQQAKLKLAKINSKKAKKGFTDEEEGEITAMKGAAGKAKKGRGVADFKTLEGYMAELQRIDIQSSLQTFRQAGRLGEFMD